MSVEQLLQSLEHIKDKHANGWSVAIKREHYVSVLSQAIAALRAGQAMRDDTYVGENGQIYSKKGFTESCVAWDTATKGDV